MQNPREGHDPPLRLLVKTKTETQPAKKRSVPLLKNLRDSRLIGGCTFGVGGAPTLQSIVVARSFCLRVFAFPFGVVSDLSRASHPMMFGRGVPRKARIPRNGWNCQEQFWEFHTNQQLRSGKKLCALQTSLPLRGAGKYLKNS